MDQQGDGVFFIIVSKVVTDVSKKSYLLAPMMPAVGKFSQITSPWSSLLRASGTSEMLSCSHAARDGKTVLSASALRPAKSRRLVPRYSETTFHAFW